MIKLKGVYMKGIIKKFGSILIVTLFCFLLLTCDDKNHNVLKTTVKFLPYNSMSEGIRSSNYSAVRNSESSDHLKFFIGQFCILQDAPASNPLSGNAQWFIGKFHCGDRTNSIIDNRDWYDVTEPRTFTVLNDFGGGNEGRYSVMQLDIDRVEGSISGISIDELGKRIFYTNDITQPTQTFASESHPYVIPWNAIRLNSYEDELIVTISVDIENIVNDNKLIEDWWKKINIEVVKK